ncbi:exopolyphosphatase [Pseudomarimonas arenosa]|uniref:Exopolyphosphatase n=1 Tax=Pseudomarimonas arenosa TaxID=2774145 RepID=A0AAW3ZJ60_9GAMM|nr:exopolyphosphatase [Pseudomarimonas arenosa]MBD8526021.1 exopolyphosphatase [Pseudomarimonas arenosa]
MPDRLQEGDLLAAVDLGSNSFHLVVARYVLGQLRVVDRLKETVRMASGLDGKGGLSKEVLQRSLDALARLGQRMRTLPEHRVRAIATNTVRQLKNPQSFLVPGETALGHSIEVVSGREEARLIYLGVAHGHPPGRRRRLVMDIGGGSTEFIIGQGFNALERESLQMGCIASTRRFFANGKLSHKRWREALTDVSAEFQQFTTTFIARGWQETLGSSGTIKAVGEVLSAMKLTRGAITPDALGELRDELLKASSIDDIKLPGLSDERRPVIAGGVLVLEAAFNELRLSRMQVAETAMREGVLYDMLGRVTNQDPRDASVAALEERYGVDRDQAGRVEQTALALFDQVARRWLLSDEDRLILGWAARIHELGLSIAHSQYHVHGAYLIRHSDIAGFSTTDQELLSSLVRCQRRSLPSGLINELSERNAYATIKGIMLLRLAVLLHRSHDPHTLPDLQLLGTPPKLQVDLPRSWLDKHPLTRNDLEAEQSYLAEIGIELAFGPAD